jgi:hypothetical protein
MLAVLLVSMDIAEIMKINIDCVFLAKCLVRNGFPISCHMNMAVLYKYINRRYAHQVRIS